MESMLQYVVALMLFCNNSVAIANELKGINELAHVIEGEASTCGVDGMLAVAHVYSRNKTMYGHSKPSPRALQVAQMWYLMPDNTDGAVFLFSHSDVHVNNRVKRIIKGKVPTTVINCADGLRLFAYR